MVTPCSEIAKWFALSGTKDCSYQYDFGDAWNHDFTLETIEQHDGTWKRRLLQLRRGRGVR